MGKLKNNDQLPIVVVGGCHNSQFNTTMSNIILGIREYGFLSYFGLWNDPTKAEAATNAMKITSGDLKELDLIEGELKQLIQQLGHLSFFT